MVSKQRIEEITSLIKSRALSAIESLSTLAGSLRDEWDGSTKRIQLLSEIVNLYDINDPQVNLPLSSESVDVLNDLLTNNEEITLNLDATNIAKLSVVQPGPDTYDLYIDDKFCCIYDIASQTINAPQNTALQNITNVKNVLPNHANACGLKYALADICDNASFADWTSSTNLASSLYALVNSYEYVLGEYVTDIISAIAKGPTALLQLITSIINKVNDMLNNADLSGLLSSTAIVLNNFAWGCVATAIGSVVSAIGAVVFAFSKIVGTVVLVAGWIATLFGRIVVSATTAFDDTRYKVSAGGDVVHAFSFVTESSSIVSPGTAAFMRKHGWNTMTVVCPHQATVYMMYLNDFDSTDNTITYEMHLSADIDISQNLSEKYIEDSSYPALVIELAKPPFSVPRPCDIAFMPSYTGFNDGNPFTQESFYRYKGTNNDTSAKIAASLRENFMRTNMLSPVDFNIFDSLKQWYSGDLTNFLDVRLCSATIIYVAYKLSDVLGKGYTRMGGNAKTIMGVRHYTSTAWFNSALKSLLNLWDRAWLCFWNGSAFGATSLLKDAFGLSNNARDDLLNDIKTVFDGLYYKTIEPVNDIIQSIVRVTYDDQTDDLVVTEVSTDHTLTVQDQIDMIENDTMFDSMYAINSDYPQIAFSAGVWSRTFAIQLPTLTFTGFIAGLIVDGLIIAATAVIATVAVVGWIKLRNYRAQLQAKAEASWYNYEDGGQTKDLWKQYKADRFKYNIVALCTGAQPLSLGLYDEESSNVGLLGNIKGLFNTNEPDEDVNLREIVRLIKGSV